MGLVEHKVHVRIMKHWKWEIEDDYAGPAPGAWAWICAGAAVWAVIIWLCRNMI